MKRFDIVEHTADTGIIAYGADMEEAFANAACGMFSLMADLGTSQGRDQPVHRGEAWDRESLVVSWLNELLYMFDVESIVFKRFDILELSRTRLKADAYGEKVDTSRHELRTGVKAATYHMLKVSRQGPLSAKVRVIFWISRGRMGMAGWQGTLTKIDDYRWEIPKAYKPGMRVPGLVYADEKMLRQIREEQSLEQVANVAFLPGIVGRSMAMPDIHWGYGFPIGGVAATRAQDGVFLRVAWASTSIAACGSAHQSY